MTRNPTLIQSSPLYTSCTPIVLIHDGGGTTFSYHCLGPLKRPVYGIENPRFGSARPWKDGIPEMAKVYVNLIRSVLPGGNLLLGGWSLGGLVSLEIARILAEDMNLHVVGIVMIDSIFPPGLLTDVANTEPPEPATTSYSRPETKLLVKRNMENSLPMLRDWILPSWIIEYDDAADEHRSDGSSTGNPSMTHQNSGQSVLRNSRQRLPPTALLRCHEYVPVASSLSSSGSPCRVDVTRHRDMLGWEDYPYDLIQTVLRVPGHHFNLFSIEHIEKITEQLILACKILETR